MSKRTREPLKPGQPAVPGGVGAVDRATSLLDAFTPDKPMLSLAELAERSEQYKSTVLRLLTSLAHSHLVERHADGRFSLGSAIPRLHAVYAASFSIERVVLPALHELVAATRESAAYHVLQGAQQLCLFGVGSPQTIRDHPQVGTLRSLERGAAARVFAAYGDPAEAHASRVCRDQFALAAVDVIPEVAAIAAPVFDANGALRGVIALTMPAMRFSIGHAPDVQRAARRITSALGGREPAASGVVNGP